MRRRWRTKRGIKLTLSNDQAQLERQISTLTAWQAQGMPAIVSFPLESASSERIAKSVIEGGGIWITYGGSMKNQSGSINFSDYERGKLLAEHAAKWANEALGGQGKAAFLIDESIELGRNRTAGLRENFEKRPRRQSSCKGNRYRCRSWPLSCKCNHFPAP